MNEKVVLPKEVGKVLEEVRKAEGDHYALSLAFRYEYGKRGMTLHHFASDYANYERYVKAIVNGYTIEQTPEESVYEFYEAFAEGTSEKESGIAYGIKKTLDLLGIKIDGINA